MFTFSLQAMISLTHSILDCLAVKWFNYSTIDWLIFIPSIIFGNIFLAIITFVIGTKVNSSKTANFVGSFVLIYALVIGFIAVALVNVDVSAFDSGTGKIFCIYL